MAMGRLRFTLHLPERKRGAVRADAAGLHLWDRGGRGFSFEGSEDPTAPPATRWTQCMRRCARLDEFPGIGLEASRGSHTISEEGLIERTMMVRSSTTRLFLRSLGTALAALLLLIFSPGAAQAQCAPDEKDCYGACIHLSDVCCPTIVCDYGSICCDSGPRGVPPDFSCEGETRCEAANLSAGDCPTITGCCDATPLADADSEPAAPSDLADDGEILELGGR